MTTALWLLFGLILGAAFLVFARRQRQAETQVLAIGLFVAAMIYVGFALAQADLNWILVEMGGTAVYGTLAWLGLRHSKLWLSAGWLLHPVWDIGLHLAGGGAAFAPTWYVLACITFDLLVAGYVAVQLRSEHIGTSAA